MKMKTSIALITSCLAFQSAYANNQAQDPRALGMGGVGTAAANSAQAQFYNPSLLVNARENEDFNFEIPVAVNIADPNDLSGDLSNFASENYISNFLDSLTEINNAINTPSTTSTPQQLIDNLISAAEGLQTGINSLSDKSLTAAGNAAIVASSPSGKIGWAGYFNAWGDAGAKFSLGKNDDLAMTQYINGLNGLASGTLPTSLLENPVDNLDSSISFDAVVVQEFGISLAKPYAIKNYNFDVGITPKYMAIKAYGFEQSLQQ